MVTYKIRNNLGDKNLNRPSVSIVIAVYNIEDYLEKCITSIINQTYENLQIIIVDDGSDDGSRKICEEFQQKDNRVEFYSKENGGLVSARKYGLSVAKGDFIICVDGDDYLEPSMIEKMIYYQQINDSDIVHFGFIMENMLSGQSALVGDFDNAFINLETRTGKRDFIVEYILGTSGEKRIYSSIWSKLFKRQVLLNSYSKISDLSSYGEDLLCILLAVNNANNIHLAREYQYHYSVRNNSMTNKSNAEIYRREIILLGDVGRLAEKFLDSNLEKDFEIYSRRRMLYLSDLLLSEHKVARYCIGNIKKCRGKKIIIYGAGIVGKDYYSQLAKYSDINIVAWVDKNFETIETDFFAISSPEEILHREYDYIVIAIENAETVNSVKKYLKTMGCEENRLICDKPEYI